jgi:hypothetical protein
MLVAFENLFSTDECSVTLAAKATVSLNAAQIGDGPAKTRGIANRSQGTDAPHARRSEAYALLAVYIQQNPIYIRPVGYK